MIAALQTVTWLEGPMRGFSFLGTKEFFMLVLPILYWCIDARLGKRVAFILLIGTGLNLTLKLASHAPRPYWISTDILALSAESTFGMPSGHAETAAGLWGLMAFSLRRRWAWIAAAALILLIGLSRIYLGVHFPLDVVAGWTLGAVTLWAFVTLWSPASEWIARRSVFSQILLCLVLPLLITLPAAALVHSLGSYEVPAEWMANAARAGEPFPAPVSMDPTITIAAALCGVSLGLVAMQRVGGFSPSGPLWKRVLCFIVGILGIAVLYIGLSAALPGSDSAVGSTALFIRFALLGFWVAAGAPWTFRLLRLNASASTQ